MLENECECGDFYHYQSPYSHAIAVARYLEIDPLSLFDTSCSVRVYDKTYSRPLIPVSIQDLTPDQREKLERLSPETIGALYNKAQLVGS